MRFKNMFINTLEPSDATLFRRRYNINDAHAGYIYYTDNVIENIDDAGKLAGAISFRIGDAADLHVYGPAEPIARDEQVSNELFIRATLNKVGVNNHLGEVNIYNSLEKMKELGDEPFIHAGTLSGEDLASWLIKVASGIRRYQISPKGIDEFQKELNEKLNGLKEDEEFLNSVLTAPVNRMM